MRPTRAFAILSLVAAACTATTPTGTGSSPPATTSPSTSPSPSTSTVTRTIYYIQADGDRSYLTPEPRAVTDGAEPGEAEAQALTATPAAPDLVTAYPADATVLGTSLDGGVLTVDWSAEVLDADLSEDEATLGVQQAIWTLRALDGVDEVRFTVEGRTDGEASNGKSIVDWWGSFPINDPAHFFQMDDLEPPITIDAPAEGATVSGSIKVRGTASVFEANVVIRLVDADGTVLIDTFATASEGAPGRGTWRKTLTLPSVDAARTMTIQAVEVSPKDGSDSFVQTRTIEVTPA